MKHLLFLLLIPFFGCKGRTGEKKDIVDSIEMRGSVKVVKRDSLTGVLNYPLDSLKSLPIRGKNDCGGQTTKQMRERFKRDVTKNPYRLDTTRTIPDSVLIGHSTMFSK